jgi:hypothetical protein
MPSGTEMHAGVYGITEADHIELQRRRHDVESMLAYAVEHRLFVTVNHIYSGLTGRRAEEDFEIFARDFHGIETMNGMILGCANRMAADFAVRFGKPSIGGSDAHTLRYVGRTFTEVSGARNSEEFLMGMRRGQCAPFGEQGSYIKLTSAVWGIGASLVKSRPEMALACPLFAAAPVVTLGNYIRELAFAWYWGQKNRGGVNTGAPAGLSAISEAL